MLDSRFFTPMINSSCGHIFVNDFVKIFAGTGFKIAKVKTFYQKVRYFQQRIHNILVCALGRV